MVCFQVEGGPLPVGDEGVVAIGGEQGQLRTWRGFHPADDEADRYVVGLTREGSVAGFGHIGRAFHPVRRERALRLGYGLDEIVQGLVLAYGDGEADTLIATDGDDGVSVEVAVGPSA